ncbi:autotransporter-associated N-terminal domain-containing protein, partial [Leptotrichia wadei]
MSNNLRQIARDLRSFVKRCKDVHYSDSLLISFLITGLLTIAPKLHADVADVASEQQEVTAQTYDAITDLRQSFMRARKENEKSLKGAQSELVQLLRQGDQVIKSPWSSFQFGTGYMNNDWGTTYRGRGGKFLEYYKRDNDLTKYVFDPTKHLYGATNLNIPRNKEPNSLTINPANIHEPYKPYVPERLDNVNMPVNPTFDPTASNPLTVIRTVNPTNLLPGGINTRNALSGGTNLKNVGDTATFQISSNIARSYDGLNSSTANSSSISATITSITSGNFYNGASASINEASSGTNWWDRIIRHSTSTAYYSGVNGTTIAPGNPGGGTGSYYTPGSYWFNNGLQYSNNTTTGYDNISSSTYSSADGSDYAYNMDSTTRYNRAYNWYLTAISTGVLKNTAAATGSVAYWQTQHNPSTGSPGRNYNQSEAEVLAASTTNTTNITAAQNYATAINSYGYNSISGSSYRDSMIDVRSSNSLNIQNTYFSIGSVTSGGAAMKVSADGKINVNGSTKVELFKGTDAINVGYAIGTAGDAELKFTGTTNSIINERNGNIAFNFQEGTTGNTGTTNVTGPVYIYNIGNNNSIYRVNHYINKLHVQNGKDSSSTSDLSSAGTDYIANSSSASANGSILVGGNNNIVFHNNAYVKEGSIALADVQIQGSNNIMAFFNNANGTVGAGTQAGWGVFGGNVNLQGVIGGNNNSASISTGNVAVYAHSGQSDKLGAGYFASNLSNNTGELKVTDINVGFGKYSSKDTLIYADNGTKVNVKNANDLITDGIKGENGAPSLKRGYDIEEQFSPYQTIIGYSTGQYVDKINGNVGFGWATGSGAHGEQTDLTFGSDVNMISREGVAYQAESGGKITAQTTRAGGYKSFIAYANGVTQAITTTTGTTVGGRQSEITITGNIVAADSNIFAPSFNNYNSVNNQYTYQNIGAYAKSGGKITIKGTTADDDDVEDKAGEAKANFDDKSLIYGMGAVATGQKSIVIFDSSADGIHIVSGINGGLYASDYGTIEFNGIITNQNNLTSAANGIVPNSAAGRKGIYKASGGNDHTNVTPFYVNRNLIGKVLASNSTDTAGILFNKDTTINMYDGILLTGNRYGSTYDNNKGYALADYFKEDTRATDPNRYDAAKYRGMKHVTVELKGDNVNLGIVNQYDGVEWKGISTTDQGNNSEYLASIATYAGGMAGINNADKHRFDSTLINSELTIKGTSDVNLEDKNLTDGLVIGTNKNDRFNDIKMESTLITIEGTAKVHGDIANRATKNYKDVDNGQVQNAGLSMNNSLSRWSTLNGQNPDWEKTDNTKSGVINKGKLEFTGGNDTTGNIAGINITYGTAVNNGTDNEGEIKIDRGYAIFATDGSIIQNINNAKIEVTGEYVATSPVGGRNKNTISDTEPKGKNYGIVGISDGRNDNNYTQTNLGATSLVNTLDITNENSTIKVQGDLAVGIYGENRNDANSSNVKITYKDTNLSTAGIDVENKSVTNSKAKGVGIALINANANYQNGASNAGGEIVLNGRTGTLGTFGTATNNILTGKNGVGIYAESAEINLLSDNFTVETADNGVGLWAMDDTHVATGANHLKTFQYNYNGASNKNGFAMAFGGRNIQKTTASNDLDIKFSNNADKSVTLAASKTGTGNGTYKGIAGILVNTNDADDTVTNRGNIEEDESSVTNVRAYGAVVNKGKFINYGKIKLNDSLDAQADQITSEDIKKANVGIFANSTNGLQTTIENHGDITIGDSTNNKNIGSWAIYGYNVNTDSKEDGSKSKITINRNNYGIYSGDGNVNIKNTKLLVGNDTVLGHVHTTSGVSTAPGAYPINRQTAYANANDLLSGLDKPRELDSAIGVYIDKGSVARNINVSADMDID